MDGRNHGICHSCRSKEHFFADYLRKRLCPKCMYRFEKCFVVEKDTKNKGRLFVCCSRNCGFWDWVVKDQSSGQCSTNGTSSEKLVIDKISEQLSHVLVSEVRISDAEELQITVTVKVCKENDSMSGFRREAGRPN